MGCGCGGGKKTVLTPRTPMSVNEAARAAQPRTYDVIDNEGAVVASTENPVFARAEARRTGGTVVLRETTSAPSA